MRIFRNCYSNIVRIKGKEYLYDESDSVICGVIPELLSQGFKYIQDEGDYIRPVKASEIESAYRVKRNYGMYKGYKVRVADYREDKGDIFVMFDNEKEGEAAGIEPWIDVNDKCMRYYEAYVPESDVPDIYEMRVPVDGFPFVCPEIVYHKKDGVWQPWHDYGTPLKDDEWL